MVSFFGHNTQPGDAVSDRFESFELAGMSVEVSVPMLASHPVTNAFGNILCHPSLGRWFAGVGLLLWENKCKRKVS
jgi:hypothetical protein